MQAYSVSYALNFNLSRAPRLASLTAPAKTVLLFEVSGDSTPIRQPGEWGPFPDTTEYLSAAGNGLNAEVWATNNYAVTSAGPVRYATGVMDNFGSPIRGNNFYAGQHPRHQGGANYLAADGHVKFLMSPTVSAGYSAITPSRSQVHRGCPTAGCRHCAPCAEGTALGTHALTFSVN